MEYLEDMKAYLDNAPLGSEFDLDDEQQFSGIDQLRNMSRNNYAKLIVSATVDRLGILGFRTAENSSEFGDKEAKAAFDKDKMEVGAQEAHAMACSYRNSYLYVDPITKRQQVIPPTNAAVIMDSSKEPAVAMFISYDRLLDKDVLRLFIRQFDEETGEATGGVEMYWATKESSRSDEGYEVTPGTIKLTDRDSEIPLDYDTGMNWVWWKQQSLKIDRVPITPMRNKDGKNEFEDYTDVVDRINHMIFQRVIIVTMQAFRQRAVKGNFPKSDPKTGEEVDYNDIFSPGPGNLWLLPETADLWESTPPQYGDILLAVKDDVRDLASLTYTPMTYMSDNTNQSAEGAVSQQDSHLSKVEDRRRRFGPCWKRHLSIWFEINGDTERANEDELEVIWQPIRTDTLVQRMSAYSSAVAAGMPPETAMRECLGWTPSQIRRATEESRKSKLLALSTPQGEPTPLAKRSFSVPGNDNGGGVNNQPGGNS